MKKLKKPILFLMTSLFVISCAEKGLTGTPDTEEGTQIFNWTSGNLEVRIDSGPAPKNTADYQDFILTVTTGGTEPEIQFPDFGDGGFEMIQWTALPLLTKEEKSVFRYKCKLEPLGSGELIILPMKIISGDRISDVVITEGIKSQVPSLLSENEIKASSQGNFPQPKPVEAELKRDTGFPIIIVAVFTAAALILFLIIIIKRRKKPASKLSTLESALKKTEKLNPENYGDFYSKAAEIIRGTEDWKKGLKEIIDYYEMAAYTGRLDKNSGLPPRSPHEDKAKMMVFFSGRFEDDKKRGTED